MISDRLKKVILVELELDDWEIGDETAAGMVPGWDSLSHARIMAAVENEYGIRLHVREIMRLVNVGQLQKLIDQKVG